MSMYSKVHLVTLPGEPDIIGLNLMERNIYGSSRIGTENPNQLIARSDVSLVNEFDYIQTVGDKRYELSNHLGNVLEVVTDRKLQVETAIGSGVLDYYIADVVSQSDYFPFGMQLPGRNGSTQSYDYGFGGKRKDDEIKGEGNSYDFGARIYDPRIGRWLSTDPHERNYPSLSSYCYVGNMPIVAIDPDGKDIIVLSTPNAAMGYGHSAVLIGNDQDGWYYYSKNGTADHGKNGPSYAPNDGGDGNYFKSLDDFANSESNFDEFGRPYYTAAFRIPSDKETDEKMKAAAYETCHLDYALYSSSCIDLTTSALEAGGFYGGDPDTDIPLNRYEEIKEGNEEFGGYELTGPLPDSKIAAIRKLAVEVEPVNMNSGSTMDGAPDLIILVPTERAKKARMDNPQLFDGKNNNDRVKDKSGGSSTGKSKSAPSI